MGYEADGERRMKIYRFVKNFGVITKFRMRFLKNTV